MAIRTFNSVGGFSVGEVPETIILANGDITTDFGTFSANVGAGNVKTDNLLYANGIPWNFTTPGGLNTQIQFNDGGSSLGGSANFTFDKTTSLFTVTGNANIGNISTTGEINSTGNVTAPWFIGNVVGNISGNIIIPGHDTGVVINDGGNANAFAGFTFTKANSFVSITGNVSAGNVSGGNLVSANYLSGTLTTDSGAQGNITSVGTLTSLSVTGTATAGNLSTGGNLTVSGQVISSLIPANDDTYTLGNTTYQWKNVYVSGNVFFSGAQGYLYSVGNIIYTDALRSANNISAGSLTSRGSSDLQGDVTIGGNLTVGGTTTYINVETLSINDPIISLGGGANNANAPSYDGKDRGVFLRNYKSDGSAPVNMYMGWDTSASEFGFGSNVIVSGEVVTFTEYGNIRANVLYGNVTGNLITQAQPNITSVGTLATLSVSGWANIGGQANVNSLQASGLSYPTSDGTADQYLKTDGSGTLSWGTVSTSSISNGTSNVNVAENANVQIVASGNIIANITGTGANITGTLEVSGNTTVGLLKIGNSTLRSSTVITTTTTPTTLVSLSGSSFRVAEYFIKGEDTIGSKYSVATVSMVHDATSADYAVYGTVNLPSSSTTGSLSVTYVGGIANLVVTPSSTDSTTWTVQYRTM
jgi:hypothetical protein